MEYWVKLCFSFIYYLGDVFDQIFFLVRGIVKIGIYFVDGKEVIKYLIYLMVMFGEFGLIGE